MRSTNRKKITYGKKDVLTDADFRNAKIRISMMVDEEVILFFKERAKESGEGYQTLMHRALREATTKPTLEERVARLEKTIEKAS
jgi:uncharacterized protein (DUF4415 family)